MSAGADVSEHRSKPAVCRFDIEAAGSVVSWQRIDSGCQRPVGRYVQTALTTIGDPWGKGIPVC